MLLKKVKRFFVRLPLGGEKHGVLSAVFGFPMEVSNMERYSLFLASPWRGSCRGATDEVVSRGRHFTASDAGRGHFLFLYCAKKPKALFGKSFRFF